MDIKKIIELTHVLQNALPFGCDGIKSKEEYEKAIAIVDEITDFYNDDDAILYDVLWPVIMRYEESDPELAEFNEELAQCDVDRDVRYARVLVAAISQFGNERDAVCWLKEPAVELGGKLPVYMLYSDADTAILLDVIGRLEHA